MGLLVCAVRQTQRRATDLLIQICGARAVLPGIRDIARSAARRRSGPASWSVAEVRVTRSRLVVPRGVNGVSQVEGVARVDQPAFPPGGQFLSPRVDAARALRRQGDAPGSPLRVPIAAPCESAPRNAAVSVQECGQGQSRVWSHCRRRQSLTSSGVRASGWRGARRRNATPPVACRCA